MVQISKFKRGLYSFANDNNLCIRALILFGERVILIFKFFFVVLDKFKWYGLCLSRQKMNAFLYDYVDWYYLNSLFSVFCLSWIEFLLTLFHIIFCILHAHRNNLIFVSIFTVFSTQYSFNSHNITYYYPAITSQRKRSIFFYRLHNYSHNSIVISRKFLLDRIRVFRVFFSSLTLFNFVFFLIFTFRIRCAVIIILMKNYHKNDSVIPYVYKSNDFQQSSDRLFSSCILFACCMFVCVSWKWFWPPLEPENRVHFGRKKYKKQTQNHRNSNEKQNAKFWCMHYSFEQSHSFVSCVNKLQTEKIEIISIVSWIIKWNACSRTTHITTPNCTLHIANCKYNNFCCSFFFYVFFLNLSCLVVSFLHVFFSLETKLNYTQLIFILLLKQRSKTQMNPEILFCFFSIYNKIGKIMIL